MTKIIVAMALVTFATRISGLMGLPLRGPGTMRATALIPVAAFAALISGGLEVRADAWLRWIVVGVGGWLSWRGAPVWISVSIGMVIQVVGASLLR